ncbi:MAG: ABC transporter permease [Acidobacteriia bacterium]|nr:ABC transporter permease [Terriglobia bacterium]
MINRIRLRLKSLWRRRQLDRDLEDELRFHLEMLGPNRADAHRRFGNFGGLKESCRDMWTLGSIEIWMQDLRYGLRTLRKSPGFTTVAIAALALGIGVNTTVFSLVNGILYKNLPFENSDRIFYISSLDRVKGRFQDMSYPDYQDFRTQAKSFDGMAATSQTQGDISDGIGLPQGYRCAQMTANAFSVIGQKPVLGRDFLPEDELPGAPPVALLTYSLWESRYGKDTSVIGRTIRVNAVPTVIIGVMSRGLRFPTESDLWLPLPATAQRQDRGNRYVMMFGRLAAGATLQSARAEMETVTSRLARQYPETNKDLTTLVQNYNEMAVRKKIRSVFWMMLAAVGFVLLIACANVANLLLARAVVRSHEISIRAALGASRWRVVRQLLMESLLLSAAGGILGWLFAIWGTRAFDLAITPTGKPAWIDFSLDYRVLLYLAAISIGTGIVFGLVPALRLSRLDVSSSLKEGGRGSGGGRHGRYLSGVLVITEMALAVVLLAGAGLMLRSFLKAYRAPVGVNTANVLTMWADLPRVRYSRPEQQAAFYQRLKAHLEQIPGVEVATIMSSLPGDGMMSFQYELEGAPPIDQRERPRGGLLVGPDYFRTMQVPLVAGRAFTEADGESGVPSAIVNQSFANRFWPRENPLGKRVRLMEANIPQAWLTVVGVAPDILQNTGNLIEHDPLLYLPYRQRPQSHMFVAARTRVPPAALGDTFRRAVQEVDEDLPVRHLATLESEVALRSRTIGVLGSMFAIFGSIAFLLASVGLYAVIAHSVNQRTQEIGVRLAMGAKVTDVLRLVFAQGLGQLAIGLALGLAGALAVTRVMDDLLVGVSPTDPVTFAAVALVLVFAGILGCAIPARRAIRVDPAITLRHE